LTTNKEEDRTTHEVGTKYDWGIKNQHQGGNWNKNKTNQVAWQVNKSNEHRGNKNEASWRNKVNDFFNCNKCNKKHLYKNCPAYGEKCRNCEGFFLFCNNV